jgi:hypothetical protein
VVPSLVGRALPRVVALAVIAGAFGCVWAVSASAAFPGRDGLLVVQPLHGPGLVLVRSNGTGGRRICLNTAVCGLPVNPVWSADGRELAYRDGPKVLAGGGIDSGEVFVIYPDGSCLECPSAPLNRPVAPIAATDGPSFLADGELGLVRGRAAGLPPDTIIGVGIDGLRYRKLAGPASSPVWSSQGRLAEVRQIKHNDQVFVVDKVGARPRQLTHDGASSPSWSPHATFLAVMHAGSIEVIDLRGRVVRRLARGHAPAWSPDGRDIAFVATHNRIAVISGRGGTPRLVGAVRGNHVDWQPIPTRPSARCVAPPGSRTVTASADAIITTRSGPDPAGDSTDTNTSWLGCLRSDGRQRMITFTSQPEYDGDDARVFATAGTYVAFVRDVYNHVSGNTSTIETFDLATGLQTNADIFAVPWEGTSQPLQSLLLTPAGDTAWLQISSSYDGNQSTTYAAVGAHDANGTRTLDAETTTTPGPSTPAPGLANLKIVADQVQWTHDGTTRSATLRH